MAMDRFYDAEDGNFWLAFPSSDRNKVDIDTYLILKKAPDSSELIPETARYKIIAIENEAPDFIKTSHYNIGSARHDYAAGQAATVPHGSLYGSTADTAPVIGLDKFSMLSNPFDNGSAKDMHEIKDPLYVEFSKDGKVSNRYRITEMSKTEAKGEIVTTGLPTVAAVEGEFHIKIDGFFGDDVRFISNDSTGNSATAMLDDTRVTFYKYVVENRAQFDGRFFVKVFSDNVFEKNIKNPAQEGLSISDYRTTAERSGMELV